MTRLAKKRSVSVFRQVVEFLHLWLGLISGVVVFVVCFTAAIWVFRDEVAYVTMPENRVQQEASPYLIPSELLGHVRQYLVQQKEDTSGMQIRLITYRKPGLSALVAYKTPVTEYGELLVNPYNGRVNYLIKNETRTGNFFNFIRAGHRFFWLPQKIGSPFVGANCLVFLVILITGIIWWYPKKWNASTRKKSFAIKWKANWKRVNIDLHNVLGFYAFLIALALTVTGVSFTFSWFEKGYHQILTGKTPEAYKEPPLSSINPAVTVPMPADRLWQQYRSYVITGRNDVLNLIFPRDSTAAWSVVVFPTQGRIANMSEFYHDQYSLKLLEKSAAYNELPAGEKFFKNTFDIHVATIWGLPSKILAALASLICASLPATGFIIWYNRKFGKKKKRPASARQPASAV